jgi:hypothetical protein
VKQRCDLSAGKAFEGICHGRFSPSQYAPTSSEGKDFYERATVRRDFPEMTRFPIQQRRECCPVNVEFVAWIIFLDLAPTLLSGGLLPEASSEPVALDHNEASSPPLPIWEVRLELQLSDSSG